MAFACASLDHHYRALVLYPFFWAVVLSFTEYSILRPGNPIFVGIKNYQDLLNDPLIWERFAFTGRFVFTAVLIELGHRIWDGFLP